MISDKKLEQVIKTLGPDTIQMLHASQDEELEHAITKAETSMKHAREELEANPQFLELKENIKAVSAGLKEVNKRQKAIIDYVLHLLEEKGKL